eukprot:TRINITY_DN7500_c0_g1_i3.p1 TRINITY_DN7500_c0_g1~~TRINITY_DN7500_c0_g1_i3.p1  ORF type:complete len:465 (+),score=112.80 TRINITY_DN7500_c0_g1_i3:121-1515(+)
MRTTHRERNYADNPVAALEALVGKRDKATNVDLLKAVQTDSGVIRAARSSMVNLNGIRKARVSVAIQGVEAKLKILETMMAKNKKSQKKTIMTTQKAKADAPLTTDRSMTETQRSGGSSYWGNTTFRDTQRSNNSNFTTVRGTGFIEPTDAKKWEGPNDWLIVGVHSCKELYAVKPDAAPYARIGIYDHEEIHSTKPILNGGDSPKFDEEHFNYTALKYYHAFNLDKWDPLVIQVWLSEVDTDIMVGEVKIPIQQLAFESECYPGKKPTPKWHMLRVKDTGQGNVERGEIEVSLRFAPRPGMRARGAVALADSLSLNFSLTHLNLRGNCIRDRGAQALAVALAENRKLHTTLTSLNLADNNITRDGALAITAAYRFVPEMDLTETEREIRDLEEKERQKQNVKRNNNDNLTFCSNQELLTLIKQDESPDEHAKKFFKYLNLQCNDFTCYGEITKLGGNFTIIKF